MGQGGGRRCSASWPRHGLEDREVTPRGWDGAAGWVVLGLKLCRAGSSEHVSGRPPDILFTCLEWGVVGLLRKLKEMLQ